MATYRRVLLVDDNQVDLYVGERVIKKFDFADEVIVVESAMEALDYLKRHINEPDKVPDIIFLDINMPELSGFDFLDSYNDLPDGVKHNIIVMMLSTSLNEEDRKRAEANQYVKQFLNKPLNAEKLEELKRLIDNPRHPD